MHFKWLIVFSVILSLSCSGQKTIELPLTQHNGFGNLGWSLAGVSTYSENDDDTEKKTYLKLSCAPKDWTEIKYGNIEPNIYQSTYQNYKQGMLSKEAYQGLQKSWDWKPDTLQLSEEPLKTKIGFVYGKDATGVVKMIVDANNNLDFSDDKIFTPVTFSPGEKINRDSIAEKNTFNVSYEKLIANKKQFVTVPFFITYISQANMFMCNFPQYSEADLNGEKIVVCSGSFTNLAYKDFIVFLMSNKIKHGDKVTREQLSEKNEYIEIKGDIYKNIGVNINSNTLILEKMSLPKTELHSTQTGYKSFNFEGKDFTTGTYFSSQQLKGKYVLIDFWAVWCSPCREEIPNLKTLYEKTDRKRFEIISIVAESPPEGLKKLIEKEKITWPQILSTDSNKIRESFGVQGYPTTFLVNPDGIIVAKNLRGKDLEDKILNLIK